MKPVLHARRPAGPLCRTRTANPLFAKEPDAVTCKMCLVKLNKRRGDSWTRRKGSNRQYLQGTELDDGLSELLGGIIEGS